MKLEAFERRLNEIWGPGSTGERGLEEIERAIALAFTLDDANLRSMMNGVWAAYVGTLTPELLAYFHGLRGRYRTGTLSIKPDPWIYLTVCGRLGVAPPAAVLIDDVRTLMVPSLSG